MFGLIYTFGITGFGALMGLFRPSYAFCAYASLAIVMPHMLWGWIIPWFPYSDYIAIPMLLGWVLSSQTYWRLGAAKTGTLLFGGFLAWGTVSAALSDYPETALLFTQSLSKVFFPFLVGITTINSLRDLKILVWTIVLSMGIVGYEMNAAYLKGFNLIESGAIGLDNNSLAIYMVTGAGFSLMVAIYSTGRWPFLIACTSSAVLAHSVLISSSRGGMLGLMCTGAAALLFAPKTPRTIVLFTLIGLLALRFVGPPVIERFSTAFVDEELRDESAQSRVELWTNCMQVIKENPVFGLGPWHWRLVGAARFGWNQGKSAHSTWFETAAEVGIPGAALLISFVVFPMHLCWRVVRDKFEHTHPEHKMYCAASIVSVVGFVVSAAFVTAWGNELFYYVVLVGLASARLISLHQPGTQVVHVAASRNVLEPKTAASH